MTKKIFGLHISILFAGSALIVFFVLQSCSVFEPPAECAQGADRTCSTGELGDCAIGTQFCENGSWGECENLSGPRPEACDNRDNDCDGELDEEEDLTANACPYPHALWTCGQGGECLWTGSGCEDGYGNCDGDRNNGCETTTNNSPDHCGSCDTPCLWDCAESSCNNVEVVSAGDDFNCAVLTDGRLLCWGQNGDSQCGTVASEESTISRPEEVVGLEKVTSVDGGNDHTCAIIADTGDTGAVVCWGDNGRGQLGNGVITGSGPDAADVRAPQGELGDLGDVSMIAAGEAHTCALRGFDVACWGDNGSGQIAQDTAEAFFNVPQLIRFSGSVNVVDVSTGSSHSCALTTTGDVYCWGANDQGQLGDDFLVDPTILPTEVLLPSGLALTQIASGDKHTCGVTINQTVVCWGDNNSGQLGTSGSGPEAREISGLEDVESIDAGGSTTCAHLVNDSLYCWGANDDGELGQGTVGGEANSPIEVILEEGLGAAQSITVGHDHVCIRTTTVPAVCWGNNTSGQLGIGREGDTVAIPTALSRPSDLGDS